ncbi:MAG: hypothetical protein CMQ53_02620 [Gammaproteobacteria bacterium]|nr:hypothetical protein [Gammaproteobacteria bacterium]
MAKYKKSAKDKKEEAAEQTKILNLESVLRSEMDDAKDFISQVGEERAESTEYYLGNEPEETSTLQSRFVSTDVRDTILFMLPSIMRTFFGTKKIVEFVPYGPEDIPVAEQQTNYINYVVQEKNPGFKILYDVFKDALVRKAGYVKAFWDDSISSSTHEYSNIDPAQYQALIMDENVEIVSESVEMSTMTMIDPMTNEEITQESPASYDLTIRRIKQKNQVCIEAIPPEEVLIARHARSLEESSYVAHRMVKTVSDLVAMGYDREEISQHAGYGSSAVDVEAFEEQIARNPFDDIVYPDRADTGSKDVLYIEHYLFYDLDEDGIDERVRVCTVGEGLHIMDMQPFDELPIISFCPDPEPHTAIGSCPADYLKPIQAAKSQIMRDTLDSLGHAIFPRMGIVEGQVNIDDVLNTDIGQPIRMRAPGMVQPFTIPFAGKEAFPILSYLDESKENRTGVSKASAGLNAEALQSSTSAAVTATMSGAQGRIELICRHFAEGGMKDLFRLVNNLIIKHQDSEDVFRLDNEFIPVDPRYWDADKDMVVNVGLSKTNDEEKMTMLSQLAGKQEQILQTLGPNNPLVTLQQYANTLTRTIEMAGFKDASNFVTPQVPPMPPQQPQGPSAEEMLAQAEMQKAQVSAQKSIIDAETDRMKIIMDDDRTRDIEEAQIRLKSAELQAKYGTQVNIAEINAIMERDREMIREAAKINAQGLFKNDGIVE